MEKIVLICALVGSCGWVFDKILQAFHAAQLKPDLGPQLAAANEVIGGLRDRIRDLEIKLVAAHASANHGPGEELHSSVVEDSPVETAIEIAREKAEKAQALSTQCAIEAIEATGSRKSALLEKAKRFASVAVEYQAVVDGTAVPVVEALAPIRAEKPIPNARQQSRAKRRGGQALAVAGGAAPFELID